MTVPDVASLESRVLLEALDDWVPLNAVFSHAIGVTRTREDIRTAAIGVVVRLLARQEVTLGDVTSAGFEPWIMSPADAVERMVSQWHTEPDVLIAPGDVVWLASTERGDRRGVAVLESMRGTADVEPSLGRSSGITDFGDPVSLLGRAAAVVVQGPVSVASLAGLAGLAAGPTPVPAQDRIDTVLGVLTELVVLHSTGLSVDGAVPEASLFDVLRLAAGAESWDELERGRVGPAVSRP